MKQEITTTLQKILKELDIKLPEKQISNLIEIPPSTEMGDFAFPCFVLAKQMKKNPNQIAEELAKKIKSKDFEKIESKGPYINFFVNRKKLATNLVQQIKKQGDKFGSTDIGKGKRIAIEFPAPNTNKPLHLGHLRNMSIGEGVSRIAEFNGEKVFRVNLNNDRGIHICKSMLAYQKFGKNKKPNKKSDHFVGDFYVLFNQKIKQNKNLEIQAQELLKRWEQGDKKTIALWKKMNKWALDGFKQTYKKFGISFDKEYNESEIYTKGREIILSGFKKRIFQKRKDKAIIVNLGNELGEKVLLRSDGTSVYVTQDLYLTKQRYKDFHMDRAIWIVANEQIYHFKVLFKIFKLLKEPFAKGCYHLAYGLVNLPEGKMKSREGTIVDADDLIKKVQELVKKELKLRYKLSKKELESRSLKIALAAIKYFLLKVDVKKNMLFNPKESINFEGDTGPYIQYSYARASSILRKAKKSKHKQYVIHELEQKEIELIKKLSQFPEIVLSAYNNFNPSVIANYSYQLAQIFNEFYHTCPVMKSEQQGFRLRLVESFRQVLKNSLNLLGIDVLEEM